MIEGALGIREATGVEEESRQPDRDPRQEDSLFHNAWARLRMALGTRLTVALAVLVVAIMFLLVVGLIWYLSPIFTLKEELSIVQRKDLVQGLASVVQAVAVLVAGVVGLAGLYFTWKNLNQTRQTTQRTLELTEQGQITERFTRAIDQLGETDDDGNPRLEIRLGGIYALERIDKESPERAYHSTVMEVLTAYIRENAPWPPKSAKSPEVDFVKPPGGGSVSESASNETAEQDESPEQGEEPAKRVPRTDIQAILGVINRREEDAVPEKHRLQSLDLRGTDLRGADLSGAHLEGADLSGAHLEGAILFNANLKGAHLLGAHLEGAILSLANLEGAILSGAHLEGAIFSEAHLKEAINLTSDQLKWTCGDDRTELPEGLDPPVLWSKSFEEQIKIIEERLKQEAKDG